MTGLTATAAGAAEDAGRWDAGGGDIPIVVVVVADGGVVEAMASEGSPPSFSPITLPSARIPWLSSKSDSSSTFFRTVGRQTDRQIGRQHT